MLKYLEITQKYLEKRSIILLKSLIKDNKIIRRKKVNDSTQVKINNDLSSKLIIREPLLYPKLKNKLSNELK